MKTKLRPPIVAIVTSASLLLACRLGQLTGATPTPTPRLTPTSVCLEPPGGLVSWWPGDGNTDDIQGENHGTLLDGATFAAGLVGRAFSFGGIGRVSAPATGLPIDDNDRTLDLWVNVNTFYAGEAFFAGYGSFGSTDQTYHLGTSGRTLFFSQWGQAIHGPDLETGRWYHVAVTNAGASVTLYLDGEPVASGDLRINTPGRTELFIGSLPGDSSKRVDGLIDEVEVFNRALSASEIRAIFLAGSGGKCK